MAYRLEFMNRDKVVAPYTGGEVLRTVEEAVTVGTVMLATINAAQGATWFRILDEAGKEVANGPEGA